MLSGEAECKIPCVTIMMLKEKKSWPKEKKMK